METCRWAPQQKTNLAQRCSSPVTSDNHHDSGRSSRGAGLSSQGLGSHPNEFPIPALPSQPPGCHPIPGLSSQGLGSHPNEFPIPGLPPQSPGCYLIPGLSSQCLVYYPNPRPVIPMNCQALVKLTRYQFTDEWHRVEVYRNDATVVCSTVVLQGLWDDKNGGVHKLRRPQLSKWRRGWSSGYVLSKWRKFKVLGFAARSAGFPTTIGPTSAKNPNFPGE